MNGIEIYDIQHSFDDRYNTIGMVEDVLFVVYTGRKEKVRLISARLATDKERVCIMITATLSKDEDKKMLEEARKQGNNPYKINYFPVFLDKNRYYSLN